MVPTDSAFLLSPPRFPLAKHQIRDGRTTCRNSPTMLRVQKSRRPYDSGVVQSPLIGRFLSANVDGSEMLIDVLEPRDPRGPPSSVEYGFGYGSSMRMYQLRPRGWNGRSAAAKKLWMDQKWRQEVLEKRRKTRGEQDGDDSCLSKEVYQRQWVKEKLDNVRRSLKNHGQVPGKGGKVSGLAGLKRSSASFKRQRMMARSQAALERHRRMKLSKEGSISV